MALETARETLELMLGHLGFIFEIEETACEGQSVLNIKTRDPARLIGREGRTLDDLQYLLNRVIHGSDEASHVVVDVENYREKENHDFFEEIKKIAERVKATGKAEKLEPMNSYDRRLIHQAFAEDPEIVTRSEEAGDARLKQIILEPRQPRR